VAEVFFAHMRYLFLFLCLLTSVQAKVTLSGVFSDGMVLQRGQKVPVWGRAEPSEKITVSFAGQTLNAEADTDGKWIAWLEPLKVEDKGEMVIDGTNKIQLHDVLVGDVWFCSGQSNLEHYFITVSEREDHEIMTNFEYPDIHLFRIEKEVTPQPLPGVRGKWAEATSKNLFEVQYFSALGLMLARDLYKAEHVPIGMIQATWGASLVEAFMSRATLESKPEFRPLLDSWTDREANMKSNFAEHQKARDKLKASGKDFVIQEAPDRLYNGMIAGLIPYAVRGILWYQGESSAYKPVLYRTLFPALISSWRESWGRPDLPFVFVQLPGYQDPSPEPPAQSFWALLREAQELALDLPSVYMVVSVDIGDKDIHPPNKVRLAPRIYRTIRGAVYGDQVPYLSPRFERMEVEDQAVRVHFRQLEGEIKTVDDQPIKGFALAGADKKWFWADAKIDGSTVVVTSDKVKNPVAVRYGFSENPQVNLITSNQITFAPFRSDKW
jgi:sialate O-acetylesterase